MASMWRALGLEKGAGDRYAMLQTMASLVRLLTQAGQLDEARDLIESGMEEAERLSFLPIKVLFLERKAVLLETLGSYREALAIERERSRISAELASNQARGGVAALELERLQRHLDRLEETWAISGSLASIEDRDQLETTALPQVLKTSGASLVFLLADSEGSEIRAYLGSPGAPSSLGESAPLGSFLYGISKRVASRGEEIHIQDLGAELPTQLPLEECQALLDAPGRPVALSILPLSFQESRPGALCLGFPSGADRRDILSFRILARFLAVGILNATRLGRLSQKAKELNELATLDGLTRLYNRRTFDLLSRKSYEEARRYRHNLYLIMADIDDFKAVNDKRGHIAGDRAISAVGAVIRETFRRATDISGRYGGEEFILLLKELPTETALEMAGRLRSAIEALDIIDEDGSFRVTVSLGLAGRMPGEALPFDLDTLIREADEALYRAKRLGKNRMERAWTPTQDLGKEKSPEGHS
jgi:diguanylate cyclase (GGDEF)-like protein